MGIELLQKIAEEMEESEKDKETEEESPEEDEDEDYWDDEDEDEEEKVSFLKKIAEAIDEGSSANDQKEQVQEENKKPEKEKKKGENPFAKKKEDGGEEKPAGGNGQAGPVPAEKPVEEAPPAGAEAVPADGAAPAEGAIPAGAPLAEGSVPPAEISPGGQAGISQIIDFLQENPSPDSASLQAFAEQTGSDINQLEASVYGLSTRAVNILRSGASAGTDPSSVDPKELEMGVQREMQTHTPDLSIAKKIALDNLNVMPDFYSRLQAMEQQSQEESSAAAVPLKPGMNSENIGEGQEETKENDPNQPVGANNRSEL